MNLHHILQTGGNRITEKFNIAFSEQIKENVVKCVYVCIKEKVKVSSYKELLVNREE